MSEPATDQSPPLRGYLVIHVGGYKQVQKQAFHVFSSAPHVVVPDRLVEAETYPVDTPEWGAEGWAVGDNPHNRFCKWSGNKPILRFTDYDEAVLFIHRLRQKRKRPNEVYTLIYVTRGVSGKYFSEAVSSLDQIAAFEATVAAEVVELEKAQAEYRKQSDAEFPEYARLREAYGYLRARSLSAFLGRVRNEGLEAVKATGPASSFYRNLRDLRAMGLLD